jgi:NADP-dependent 3-hydroxy acid dehydrogenase YdfG
VVDLEGKVAFVTGATSGIGLGIAKALAAAGCQLAVTYRRADRLAKAMQELRGACVYPVQADVTNRKEVSEAAEEAERRLGQIHILCNSAGVNVFGPMDEATYDDWDWLMGVNVGGVINTLVAVLPRIKAHGKGGHVVNVGSMSSFIAGPRTGLYTATKFAVRGLTESLRYCLASQKIGVSLVCPGLTQSKIYEAPLHRPASLSNTAFPVSQADITRLQQVHEAGMHPDDVGIRTVQAIRTNDFYVFSHPEFKEELRQLSGEIMACIPDEPVPQARLAVEAQRLSALAAARQAIEAMRHLPEQ